jgi:hypothetical protein
MRMEEGKEVCRVTRTKRERMIPGEGELLCGEAPEDSKKTSVSCRREEKKPISTNALQRTGRGDVARERGD